MADIEKIGKLLLYALGAVLLYEIAINLGIIGIIFDVIVLGVAGWMWWNRGKKEKINAVRLVYLRQVKSCERMRNPFLQFLVMHDEHSDMEYLKGRILGGPINRYAENYNEKRITRVKKDDKGKVIKNLKQESVTEDVIVPNDKKDPRAVAITVLYSQNYGFPWDTFLIGGIWRSMFDNPHLMTIYSNQLHSPAYKGNLVVKGTNTHIRGGVEYVNDPLYQDGAELEKLRRDVMNESLEHQLSNLPNIVDDAVSSDAFHKKFLQGKDDVTQ